MGLLKSGQNILGLNVTFTTNIIYTVRYGNGSTATLPLEVFTQGNFVADFIQLNINFMHKNDKFVFELPSGALGVTYALHL